MRLINVFLQGIISLATILSLLSCNLKNERPDLGIDCGYTSIIFKANSIETNDITITGSAKLEGITYGTYYRQYDLRYSFYYSRFYSGNVQLKGHYSGFFGLIQFDTNIQYDFFPPDAETYEIGIDWSPGNDFINVNAGLGGILLKVNKLSLNVPDNGDQINESVRNAIGDNIITSQYNYDLYGRFGFTIGIPILTTSKNEYKNIGDYLNICITISGELGMSLLAPFFINYPISGTPYNLKGEIYYFKLMGGIACSF